MFLWFLGHCKICGEDKTFFPSIKLIASEDTIRLYETHCGHEGMPDDITSGVFKTIEI